MKWVTRERPKIDRIACPWLISRFIDRAAEFHFVPGDAVLATAGVTGATPFDVPGAELSHSTGRCSFDAFLSKYRLDDPALTPQSAGLFAISQGLSRNFRNDQEVLGQGFVMYDALYSWARKQPTPTVGGGLSALSDRLLALMSDWNERRRQRRQLHELDDWLLQDVGITRRQANAEARKPFWMP